MASLDRALVPSVPFPPWRKGKFFGVDPKGWCLSWSGGGFSCGGSYRNGDHLFQYEHHGVEVEIST